MKWFYLSLVIAGLLFMGGCNLPTPCAPSEMGIAGNLNPSNYALVGLSPVLTWEYPSSSPSPYPYPSGTSDCAITGYKVYLARFNEQYHDLGGNVSGSSNTSFTPAPLEPASMYFWEVRAVSSAGPGPLTGKHAFITGPVCDVTSVPEPYAHSPSGTINTLRPAFIWWGGNYASAYGCLPSGYRFELSTDPAFGSTVAAFDAPFDPSYGGPGWTPDSDLLDCTNYYWRVAAMNGGEIGPFANKSFRTQVGFCPLTFIFIPNTNANCRIGPNPLYNRVTLLTPGDRLAVVARHSTEDGMWYKLQLPGSNTCWAAEQTGQFEGDPNEVLFSDDFPSLPEEKPDEEGEPPEPSVPACNPLIRKCP